MDYGGTVRRREKWSVDLSIRALAFVLFWPFLYFGGCFFLFSSCKVKRNKVSVTWFFKFWKNNWCLYAVNSTIWVINMITVKIEIILQLVFHISLARYIIIRIKKDLIDQIWIFDTIKFDWNIGSINIWIWSYRYHKFQSQSSLFLVIFLVG